MSSSHLHTQGYLQLPGAFAPSEMTHWITELEAAMNRAESSTIRSQGGTLVAARNILEIFRPARTLWKAAPLLSLLQETLGEGCGLVRGLYFDKHPERSWSLPWHQDLAIAVQRNDLPTNYFRNPTTKAGVPHVQAPFELLSRMLTLRIHLDEVTDENGPLQVMPGTHTSLAGDTPASEIHTLHAQPGDVLAMRPLLFHRSGYSVETTTRHRRVLYLEFAADSNLPDGFQWERFEVCA